MLYLSVGSSCFCSLWLWLWEESDSLPAHLYSEPQRWNQYYIPAIPEVKGQPLSSSHGDCPLPPLVMLVNILQIYRSETVERWPYGTRCCISNFYNAERTLLKLIFKINWIFFFVRLLHKMHILICIIVDVAISSVVCLWFLMVNKYSQTYCFCFMHIVFFFSVSHCKNHYVKTKVQQLTSKDQSQLA